MKPIARDWIDRAYKARRRPDECRKYLEEAEAIATTGNDWMSIAEEWVKLGDAHAARRCIAAAFGNPSDSGTFTHAALLFFRELGDEPSAREALARGASFLQAKDNRYAGGDWASLAWAYVHTLDDRAMARETLELALTHVREDAWQLLYLAKCYVEELGDRVAARALIVRAEAVADDADADRLADAYRDLLGDSERARQIVEECVARTNHLIILRSLARHAERTRHAALERAAIAKAESLASTSDEWLDIADYYYDRDPRELDAVSRCLERALAADAAGVARIAIANAYRHRLGDHDTAARLAAPGLAPKDLINTRHELEGWDAEPSRLLDWLRTQLDAKQCNELASSAGFATEKHLAVIADIVTTGLVPYPLEWYPREALQFACWKTGSSVKHVRRAFACTVLLVDAAGPEFRDAWEGLIPILIESCRELGPEALAGATGLLVTLAQSFDPALPSLPFALLGVLLAAAAHDPHDVRLPALCDRMVTIVPTYDRVFTKYSSEWLLGLTNFDSRHALYRSLAAEILATTDPALAHLATIASRLQRADPNPRLATTREPS